MERGLKLANVGAVTGEECALKESLDEELRVECAGGRVEGSSLMIHVNKMNNESCLDINMQRTGIVGST